jgi:hypothetical protein
MSRRSRRRGRGGESSLVPSLIIGALIILGGVFVTFVLLNRAPDVDSHTGCPIEDGVSKNAIFFLLDTTQELSATQQKLVKNILFGIVDAAESYDRIQIYEVDPARESLLKPLFAQCKPSPNDKAGPVVARFRESQFRRELDEYFQSRPYERPTSPIVGAIGSVAASFPQDKADRRLIIASDFLENSDLLNQYRASWRATASQNKKQIYDSQPRLEGIKVSILFVPRPEVLHHDKEFANWWINYLEESGADVTHQEFGDPSTGKTYFLDPFIPITG